MVKTNEIHEESSSGEESVLFKIGNNNRPVCSICVEDTAINMLIDSESTLSIIDSQLYVALKLRGTVDAAVKAFERNTKGNFTSHKNQMMQY